MPAKFPANFLKSGFMSLWVKPSKSKKQSRFESYAWLLLNTVLWGAAFAAVKPALSVTTPFRYLFYRYIIAIIFSAPILWHYKPFLLKKTKKRAQLLWNVIRLEGIGLGLALGLLYTGLKYTTSIEANLLTTTLPIFITVGGVLLLREKEERHEFFGLIISFLATLILVISPIWESGTMVTISILGNLLILGSNLLNMIYFPLAKANYAKFPKFLVTTLSNYVGLVFFAALSLFEVNFSISNLISAITLDLNHQSVWFASLYMGIFGSIIGLTAYIKGQDGIEASEASLFYYLQPLVAIPLGVFLLGEGISIIQIGALMMVILGVWVAERRKT